MRPLALLSPEAWSHLLALLTGLVVIKERLRLPASCRPVVVACGWALTYVPTPSVT